MEETLRKTLTETPEGGGALSRYAKTYTIDSINQFSREYMTAISNDLGYEWYAYRGSNLETTREFCEHMTKKEYVHKSEFPEILKGKIDGHQCRIYDKTGLPYGMKEGTKVDNFTANCGGWNCGHQLVPLRAEEVPVSVRNKLIYEQKEGILEVGKDNSEVLYFDPTGIVTFADLTTNLAKRVAPTIRKKGFGNFLAHNKHKVLNYTTGSGKSTSIYVMEGARYNEQELHISEKLAKSGYHVLFPNKGDLGKGRKNDVYLYDAKTYVQQKVELKSLFGETAETIKSQIISGTGQAGVIAYDIQSNIKKQWLIQGLRGGWSKGLKSVMVNWKGQWYNIYKDILFSEEIYHILK
jgi:hypothetical protein